MKKVKASKVHPKEEKRETDRKELPNFSGFFEWVLFGFLVAIPAFLSILLWTAHDVGLAVFLEIITAIAFLFYAVALIKHLLEGYSRKHPRKKTPEEIKRENMEALRAEKEYAHTHFSDGSINYWPDGNPLLDQKIDLLMDKLHKRIYPDIVFPAVLLQDLREECPNDDYKQATLKRFAEIILNNAEVKIGDLLVTVSIIKDEKVAGTYENDQGFEMLTLKMQPTSDISQAIFTIGHECAHKFLFSKGIGLPDIEENEQLTDIATLFMGLGEYAVNGHRKAYSYTSKDSKNQEVDHYVTVGYLSFEQMNYCWQRLKNFQEQEKLKENLQKEINGNLRAKVEAFQQILDYVKENLPHLTAAKLTPQEVEELSRVQAEIDNGGADVSIQKLQTEYIQISSEQEFREISQRIDEEISPYLKVKTIIDSKIS